MIDIVLSRGGWSRVSDRGGNMKDADMLVEQAITGELAIVQARSASNHAELDRYVEVFDNNPGWSRLIYACHSPAGDLKVPSRSDIWLWARAELARRIFRHRLIDWLFASVG